MLPSGAVGMTSVLGVITGVYSQVFGQHVLYPLFRNKFIRGFNRIAGVLMRQRSCL